MRIGFLEHIPKWRNQFLPSEAGEVSASYADGGVMSVAGGAHDPSARFAGTSPSRNPRRGGVRESMRPGYAPAAGKMGMPVVVRLLACLAGAELLSGETHHG